MVFQVELARLDFGEIQNIVDDGEQRVAAHADGFDKALLLFRQGRFHQEAGHADHGVERRANLVAHLGEEFGFRLGCIFGGFFGALQFRFNVLARRHIARDAGQADQLPGIIVRGHIAHLCPDNCAVLAHQAKLMGSHPVL